MVAVNAVAQLWWVIPVLVQARGRAELPAVQRAARDDLVDDLAVGVAAAHGLLDELRRASATAAGCGRSRPRATRCCSSRRSCSRASSSPPWRWRRSAGRGAGATRPFFLLLTLVGLLVMTVGFPDGTPLRRGVTFAYYRVESIQFLRTTYKAGALPALGLAVLGGAAFAALWDRLGAAAGRPWARPAAAVGAAGLAALAAWPLVSGRAPERQLAFSVPSYWRDLARDLDAPPRRHPRAGRARPAVRLLPLGRDDRRDPARRSRSHPVATRWIVPFADLPLDRAAVGGRRPDRPGAPAPRPARAAARPHGRRRPRRRGRRRPLAQRRGARGRRRAPARRGLGGRRAYGPPVRAAPDAGHDDPGAAGARAAAATRCAPAGSSACCRAGRSPSSTAARARSTGPRGLRRARSRPPDRLRARPRPRPAACARRRGPGRRSSSRTRTAAARSPPRTRAAGAGRSSSPTAALASTARSSTRSAARTRRAETVAVLRGVRARDAPTSRRRRRSSRSGGRSPRSTATPRPRGSPTARSSPSRHALTVTFTGRATSRPSTLLPYSDSRGRRARGRDRRPPVRRPSRDWNRLPVRLRGTSAR